ncbi:MAG TPA: Ltp family lipoprotein, partial [Longimicrobium sp.]|nr:Ltp family lipoprotein [Longimicrobium sp.]
MALVTCPDCGTQVSDTAPNCPKCARPLGPAVGNVSHAPVARKKPFYTRKRFIIPAALLGLVIVMNMASGGGDSGSQVQPQSTDAPVASAPQDPETPGLTTAQQNALRSAENYLQMSGFSRQGLIDQLSSEAGEQ